MEMVRIFGLPAALLVLAFVANRLSKLTRVPDLIVLLVIGKDCKRSRCVAATEANVAPAVPLPQTEPS
jgi:hypothetical protein